MATTVANPGNIVVPLSEIIDRLQGKLSSADIEQLLSAIISRQKTEVRPGDLITADLFNQVLTDLEDLNAQVAQLAGGGSAGNKNALAIATFHDAWQAYGGLAKSVSFLPTTATVDAINSGHVIEAYLQDVTYTALVGGSLAYLGGTNTLLDAFGRLYGRQHDLVVLFMAPIAGISNTTDHQRFATMLNRLLEQDEFTGAPSLKKALTTADLSGVIDAQDRINGMVRTQSGDVTTGNFEVTYLGAEGPTETLVIGSLTPVVYKFKVSNKTNRTLDAQLTAEFLPPRDAWTSNTSILVDGIPRSSVTLTPFNPLNPTDPSATKEVRVPVTTPAGATNGQTGTLQLMAFVPPPVDRRDSASRDLTVSTTSVPQTPGIVSYSAGTPVIGGDLAHAHQFVPVDLTFEFAFSKGTGPASRSFRFRLDISSPSADTAFFRVDFTPNEVAVETSTPTQQISKAFTLNDGDIRSVKARIMPLLNSTGKNLTFTATVESATDSVKAESAAFTVTVV